MIKGFFGLPGQGKTYSMVHDILKEAQGRTVFSNFHLEVPTAKKVIYLQRPQELINCENGIVLIDEAGLWMPSFIWKLIPVEVIWQLAQVRKCSLDLWYSAQNPARVVKVLREITYESCYMVSWFKKFFVMTVQSGIADGKIVTRFIPFKKSVGDRYDTMEKVSVISKDGQKNF